jgi:hypothetical protein
MRRLAISLATGSGQPATNWTFAVLTPAVARREMRLEPTLTARAARVDERPLAGTRCATARVLAGPAAPGTSRGPDGDALHKLTDALRAMLVGGTAMRTGAATRGGLRWPPSGPFSRSDPYRQLSQPSDAAPLVP